MSLRRVLCLTLSTVLLLAAGCFTIGPGDVDEIDPMPYEVLDGTVVVENGRLSITANDQSWARGVLYFTEPILFEQDQYTIEVEFDTPDIVKRDPGVDIRFTMYLAPIAPDENKDGCWYNPEDGRVGGQWYTGEYLSVYLEIDSTNDKVLIQVWHKAENAQPKGRMVAQREMKLSTGFPAKMTVQFDNENFQMLFGSVAPCNEQHGAGVSDWEQFYIVLEVQNVNANLGTININSIEVE
ncbi:MAG TPA: hypothetical protein GXX57_05450 [Firmicutes bacterium]|nr:hypothetical protein [Bacillota bacterium]